MSDAPVRIGHYELLRKLGAGGMGEVHLARDTRLEREVAINESPTEIPISINSVAEDISCFTLNALLVLKTGSRKASRSRVL